jgi:hypothetical protein
MSNALSSLQFDGGNSPKSLSGQSFPTAPDTPTPLSLSAGTSSSAKQATAWRNKGLGGRGPLSLSKNTAGTTYSWDDNTSGSSSIPASDKGAGRN